MHAWFTKVNYNVVIDLIASKDWKEILTVVHINFFVEYFDKKKRVLNKERIIILTHIVKNGCFPSFPSDIFYYFMSNKGECFCINNIWK